MAFCCLSLAGEKPLCLLVCVGCVLCAIVKWGLVVGFGSCHIVCVYNMHLCHCIPKNFSTRQNCCGFLVCEHSHRMDTKTAYMRCNARKHTLPQAIASSSLPYVAGVWSAVSLES